MKNLALDRLVNRGANVVHRLAHKHNHAQAETSDDNRALKKADSNEGLDGKTLLSLGQYNVKSISWISDSSSKTNRALSATQSKGPVSPKPHPSAAGWRRTPLVNANEQESDPIYNNVNRTNKKEVHTEDEGDLIEHEILDIVEQEELKEQHRNTPPSLPGKKRTTPIAQEGNIDIEIDPTNKLVHPGMKDDFINSKNRFVFLLQVNFEFVLRNDNHQENVVQMVVRMIVHPMVVLIMMIIVLEM